MAKYSITDPFQKLLAAARRGSDQDWEMIDQNIQQAVSKMSVGWAVLTGLRDEDDNVRDFSATLIDASGEQMLRPHLTRIVIAMMNDTHLPVAFRLASSRWKNGDRSEQVRDLLVKAATSGDETMTPIASELLKQQ